MDIVSVESKVTPLKVVESPALKQSDLPPKPAESLADVTERVKEANAQPLKKPTSDQEQELELNKALRKFGATELKVELRDAGEGPVFHIVDKETGKELLQIPSEYKLSIERTVEMLRGALFDKRV
jgi:uncharacterized FlaG/YvyC family protein